MFSLRPVFISSALFIASTLFPTFTLACPPYGEQEWYVKAGADPSVATGSEDKPFARLIDAQNASCVGDEIKIIPVDSSIPALDGGIILKDDQKLQGLGPKVTNGDNSVSPRITNTTGDAITLANNNKVQNIFISEPKGGGITAIDKSSGKLKDLLIVRSTASNVSPGFPPILCNIVLDSTSTSVNNDASNLVSCGDFIAPGLASSRINKGAINLLNEDVSGIFKIQSVITKDRPINPPPTGKVWEAGLVVSVAGNANLQVSVDNFISERSNRGIRGEARDKGTLVFNGKNITVMDPINDGIALFTGFFCSGIDPNADLGGVTCAEIAGSPIPISHSNLIAYLDHYNFKGFEWPNSDNNNYSLGLEFGPNDQGTSRIEIHMQNSLITQAPAAGIDIEAPIALFSADSIVDFGCLKNCNKKIYTSNGNNILYSNGVNGFNALGISPLTLDQVTDSIDLILNGGNNNLDNNIVVAQGNYWSGVAMSPDKCVKVDSNLILIQPIPANSNCSFITGGFDRISTYFDASYPLLEIK